MPKFPEHQYIILNYFKDNNNEIELNELSEKLTTDPIFISASVQTLESMDYLKVNEEKFNTYKLGKEGIEILITGLPEKIIVQALLDKGDNLPIKEITDYLNVETRFVGSNLKFLTMRDWVINKKGNLMVTDKGRKEVSTETSMDKLLNLLTENEKTDDDLKAHGLDFANIQKYLKGRKNVVTKKERVKRYISITEKGNTQIKQGFELLNEVTQLTNTMLLDGSWRDVELKKYALDIDTQKVVPGKSHPFIRILNETRQVFLQMGFSEISSPIVESGFWDFDALFQPQDHPAREMQDTFYVRKPGYAKLPADDLVQKVKETHETGGDTGSKGWKYKWDIDKAKKNVLRTHTTSATARALEKEKMGPKKVFIVGPVFRRETVDYKHLPLFHQVDGIIIDAQASFAKLLGTLQAFYQKMGFEKFEFRPAFFPYTEPSVEVFVWHKKKQDWFEMGGAGVFRPEVTLPLGCSDTVLAWGLGLERLAMFRYELADIREIYMSDIKWLENIAMNYQY